MMRYKVISNNGVNGLCYHNFPISAIVVVVATGLTDKEAVFALVDDKARVQVVEMKDVEPLALSQHEAAAKLSEVVSAVNSGITEAERLADEYGLSFDLDTAYGMGGTYYGTGNAELGGRYGPEAGWNPSSTSC